MIITIPVYDLDCYNGKIHAIYFALFRGQLNTYAEFRLAVRGKGIVSWIGGYMGINTYYLAMIQ